MVFMSVSQKQRWGSLARFTAHDPSHQFYETVDVGKLWKRRDKRQSSAIVKVLILAWQSPYPAFKTCSSTIQRTIHLK